MTVDINGWVGLLGFLFVVVGALGVAIAILRANYAKTTVESLRDDNEDLRKRLGDRNDEIIVLKTESEAAKRKIEVLEDLARGNKRLDHLQQQVDAHDRRVDERHNTLIDMMRELKDSVQENVGELIHAVAEAKS